MGNVRRWSRPRKIQISLSINSPKKNVRASSSTPKIPEENETCGENILQNDFEELLYEESSYEKRISWIKRQRGPGKGCCIVDPTKNCFKSKELCKKRRLCQKVKELKEICCY